MAYLKWHIEILKTLILTLLLLFVLLIYAVNRDVAILEDVLNTEFCGTINPMDDASEFALLGKKLFKANCATCHNKNMKDRLTGPPLMNAVKDWAAYPKDDLYRWINNPMKLIADGHPRATELWNEWGPSEMTAFPNLTEVEIDAIFEYVDLMSN